MTSAKPKRRSHFSEWICNGLLAVLLLWITFPYVWSLICSFKRSEDLFTRTPSFVPNPFTLDNYAWALAEPMIVIPLRNSVVVASLTAIMTILLSSLAAYSLARFNYPGKPLIMVTLLSSQMLPTMLLVVPIFVIFNQLHLFHSFPGLILSSASWTVPYAVIMLRSFVVGVPIELEEAARIDGCNQLDTLRRVTLPLVLPGLVAAGLFVFVWTWGDMIFPLILTKDISRQTAALSLFTMLQSTRGATNYGGMLAGGVLFTLPTVVLFSVMQRYLIQGMTAGAVKG